LTTVRGYAKICTTPGKHRSAEDGSPKMATKMSSRGKEVRRAIRERRTFATYGALRGEAVAPGGGVELGRLYGPDRERLAELTRSGCNGVDFVVYSYATPIAWHGSEGWTVPDCKYSVTTSKHQSIVHSGINVAW